jgi:hypothetical protein
VGFNGVKNAADEADTPVAMERRQAKRTPKRLVCDVTIAGRRYPGWVADLSPTGLFVETDAFATPGVPVRVRVRELDGSPLELDAVIAHRLRTRSRLEVREGLGLRLAATPPARYVQLLAEGWADNRDQPRAYRVHVKDPEAGRARSFEMTALSELHAADLAVAVLGEAWELVEVEPA